jgi:hypothetical protein
MRLYFFGYFAILLGLSLEGLSRSKDLPLKDPDVIEKQIEEKFKLRDYFKEKGNYGRYLKTTYH